MSEKDFRLPVVAAELGRELAPVHARLTQSLTLLQRGERVLLHGEELGDRVCGLIAGYLLWNGLVETAPRTVTVIERLTQRQLGPAGREMVAVAAVLPSPQA